MPLIPRYFQGNLIPVTDFVFPAPSADLTALVEAGIPKARHRAFPIEWKGRKVWVKVPTPYNFYLWHRVQAMVAALLGNAMLKPTVSIGGEEGLRFEARRLCALKEKGIAVPDVVALTKGWLVTDHIGTPLQDLLDDEQDERTRQIALVRGALALADLHQKGEWHGSGQVRDLIALVNGDIGFIDFEEDLLAVMSLAEAQARDVLLMLMSAARYARGDADPLPAMLAAYKEVAPATVWSPLGRIAGLLNGLATLLRPFNKRLGRDAKQALRAVDALKGVTE